MFNLEFFTKFLHHFVIQILPIVCYYPARNAVATDDVILDKPDDNLSCDVCIRSCFDPFGEIVYGYQDEAMSVGRFWLDHSNHVDSPHGERPRGREYVEKRWWHMNSIGVDLTFVTPLCVLVAIRLHCQPIISCSQHFPCHGMSIGVSTKGTFMYLSHEYFCFFSVNASEQNHVEVSLVQNIFIQEESTS